MTGSHVLVFLNQGYNTAGLQHKTELLWILKVKKRKLLFAQPHVLPNLFYCISYANTKKTFRKKVSLFFYYYYFFFQWVSVGSNIVLDPNEFQHLCIKILF